MKSFSMLLVVLLMLGNVFGQTIPSPANNFNGLTGAALETAAKDYYADQAQKQAAAVIQKAQAAAQDPIKLAQQVSQLQAENTKLKEQLKRAQDDRDHALKSMSDYVQRQSANNLAIATSNSSNKETGIQASEILTDFDASENDAKHKYAVDSFNVQGQVQDFVYDRFGNGDVILVLAQSDHHSVGIRYTQQQLGLLSIPSNNGGRYGAPRLVHFVPDLNAIVGNCPLNQGGANTPVVSNVILLKQGDQVNISVRFKALENESAVFNVN